MNKYISRYFGEMALDKMEEWYESEIELKERVVTLDLYIEDPSKIEITDIEAIDKFLDNLIEYEVTIRSALKKDLKQKGFTHSYIQIVVVLKKC